MKYKYSNISVPKEKRAEYNEKLLTLIRLEDMQGVTPENIFDVYTGDGGLHGLNFNDFGSYHDYKEAKQAFEQGQFFTHPDVCRDIVGMFPVGANDFCADLTFGMGHFINVLPNESYFFGTELDTNAYTIAKYLYPNANLENKDIRAYAPSVKFDYIFGNPPFNLRWKFENKTISSQEYYCEKAAMHLKPMGVMAIVVPKSWLSDQQYYSGVIARLDHNFTYICQYDIAANTQRNYGTDFPTKVLVFAKKSQHIESKPYKNESLSYAEAKGAISLFFQGKGKLKAKLAAENAISTDKRFLYKVNKYLYEIKTHAVLKPYHAKAVAYVQSLKGQVMPKWIADIKNPDERLKQWNKIKVTENKVLSYLKRVMQHQDKKQQDRYEYVKTKYGVKLKAYSDKAQASINLQKELKSITFNDAVINGIALPKYQKIADKRRKMYDTIKTPYQSMGRNEHIDNYLKSFTFQNDKKEACTFNNIQFTDIGLLLQKPYSILNWSPGGGKTAAAYAIAKYNERFRYTKNTIIVSAAISIHITWCDFLKLQGQDFIQITCISDFDKIQAGQFIIISSSLLSKKQYRKKMRNYVKSISKKCSVVFDESDEMTNSHSLITKSAFACFRDMRYKLLTTGTLTRNRISEVYPQFRLLYNNSINMLCECDYYYLETKDKQGDFHISKHANDHKDQPFPARGGYKLFSDCFNPSKVTVFGQRKQNQDIFNESHIRSLIEKTVITRRFKEIAGHKYDVHNINISQNAAERNIYHKIIHELHEIIPQKSDRVGRMKRITDQMNLLIDATSTPQLIKGYESDLMPNKAKKILEMVGGFNERVAVGCTSLKALDYYTNLFIENFKDRNLYVIHGAVPFHERKNIISYFEADETGILLCMQQALRASVNIPSCNKVIVESKQWNIPKIEQWFFRFIRYNSLEHTDVYIISYKETIEMNLLALLMAKERLNDYIKTRKFKEEEAIFEEFGIDLDILNDIMEKSIDNAGRTIMNWGKQAVSE